MPNEEVKGVLQHSAENATPVRDDVGESYLPGVVKASDIAARAKGLYEAGVEGGKTFKNFGV